MGLLTDSEIEARLNSPNNLVNRLVIHPIVRRQVGTPEIPTEIKKVIAILGNEGETCRDLASNFGISKSVANELTNGRISHLPNPELKKVISKVKEKLDDDRELVEGKAVAALLETLELIPARLNNPKKAKSLSGVAKDLASVANQMANRNDKDGNGERAVHLHLYAPHMKKVTDYETIDI